MIRQRIKYLVEVAGFDLSPAKHCVDSRRLVYISLGLSLLALAISILR